jgi:acetyl esterase/lipase
MTFKSTLCGATAATASFALFLAGCSPKPVEKAPPATEVSAEAAQPKAGEPAADMQKVLDELKALGGKPIETLKPEEARMQPTPTDAVKAVMMKAGMPTTPDPVVTAKDVTYPTGGGTQKARVYMPAGAKGPLPVILYIHGGGWVIADLDVYDSSPRALAKGVNAVVVSIEYRHAPEAKFPAAHDDANAAYKWVLANAAKWGGDPDKAAVVGESAGGNMAVNVAITARDKKMRTPASVIAVYPVADSNMATASKVKYAAAKPLDTPMLAWFFTNLLKSPAEALDKRLNLVGADLKGLPPTTIILAEIDPLHDDGANLADKLKAAGVTTEIREFPGVTHEFFGMGSVVANAKSAEDYAVEKLKAGFGG